MMCSISSEPIPGKLRYEWLTKCFENTNVTIVHVTDENPQLPEEHPYFWQIWGDTIKRNTPANIEVVFSSEDYGIKLAELLEIEHVMVDKERKTVPISATMVRENPFKHWKYIVGPAKSYFVKRIVIVGPESVGKTVLCQRLAEHFNTAWVPEYGRELYEKNDGKLDLMDFPEIVVMQNKNEDRIAENANKILFCDTENITTKVFCHIYHPDRANELDGFFDHHIGKSKKYHKYFYLSPKDVLPVQDGTRLFFEKHETMLLSELKKAGADFEIISGDFEQRFQTIKKEIENLF
jgi:NadR type nicotinamide-nucleotide adenylyltransferase